MGKKIMNIVCSECKNIQKNGDIVVIYPISGKPKTICYQCARAKAELKGHTAQLIRLSGSLWMQETAIIEHGFAREVHQAFKVEDDG